MTRRIWIAEGYASDGDVYGRALQLPDGSLRKGMVAQQGGSDVQRAGASILKSHLGDIPSCPCLDSPVPQDEHAEPARGGAHA